MTVRLRPHHLLCMLTYVGKGYSPAFVENYERIAERLTRGEAIELVDGPDDICAPIADGIEAHCHRQSVIERDDHALQAVGRLIGHPLAAGMSIIPQPDILNRLRGGFSSGAIRKACQGCEWSGLCDSIAVRGYLGARVMPDATG